MKAKHVKTRYSGKSFATASKKISDKYKDRDINPLSKRSFMAEIEELMKLQELVRSQEAATNTLQENKQYKKNGGFIKYGGGTQGFQINLGVPTQPVLNTTVPYLAPGVQKPVPFTNSPVIKYPGISGTGTPVYSVNGKPLQVASGESEITKGINLKQNVNSVHGSTLQTPSDIAVGSEVKLGNPLATILSDGNTLSNLTKNKIAANKNKFLSKMMDPLIAGKAAEFLGKSAMAIGGYDKYAPILNPYEAQSRRELENLRFDITPIQQRLQQEGARGRGSIAGIQNEAVRQSLLQNTQSEIMGRTQEAMMSGQQQENQYRQARAAGLQSLGAENVAARNLSEQLTTQSKAGYQQSLQNMLSSVGQAGQEITNLRANTAQQQLLASTLKTKNFEIQDVSSIFKKAMSMGKMTVDDMLKFTQMDEQGQTKYVEEMKKNIGDDVSKTNKTTPTTVEKRFGGILPGLKI